METVESLILSPTKQKANDSSIMDSNQEDDLFTMEDILNLSSNLKSSGGKESNDNSYLPSQPVYPNHKRDILPSLPSPKRTALSYADNIPTVVLSDASDSPDNQKQKEEQILPRNESLPRVMLIREDLKRKSDENGSSRAENIEGIQEDSPERNPFKSKVKIMNNDSKPLQKLKRKFKNSSKHSRAVRLTQNNISAEVIEGILFDSLEGELILAKYQKQSFLNPESQQKLVDILISRSSNDLLRLPRLTNYFPKLADEILALFPNEDRDTYYAAPSTHYSGYSKGMLIDQWHNLKREFKKNNMLPVTSSSSADVKNVVKPKVATNVYLTDEVKKDKEWLAKCMDPVADADNVMKRWEATYEYRCKTRTTEPQCLTKYSEEWPILKCPLAVKLIKYDFEKAFKSCGPSTFKLLWERFFNELYKQKGSTVLQHEGWMLIEIYKKNSSKDSNNIQLEGLQLLILPYLLPAPNNIRCASGTIKPTFVESANGFVVWSKTYESINSALGKRCTRYAGWKEEVRQPCIVLVGEFADCIHSCYIHVHDKLWKMQSPLKALDLLTKLFLAFNLKFPVDCTSIYLVIVQVLYNTTPEKYNITPTIQSLCEALKKKLEIGEALER